MVSISKHDVAAMTGGFDVVEVRASLALLGYLHSLLVRRMISIDFAFQESKFVLFLLVFLPVLRCPATGTVGEQRMATKYSILARRINLASPFLILVALTFTSSSPSRPATCVSHPNSTDNCCFCALENTCSLRSSAFAL